MYFLFAFFFLYFFFSLRSEEKELYQSKNFLTVSSTMIVIKPNLLDFFRIVVLQRKQIRAHHFLIDWKNLLHRSTEVRSFQDQRFIQLLLQELLKFLPNTILETEKITQHGLMCHITT